LSVVLVLAFPIYEAHNDLLLSITEPTQVEGLARVMAQCPISLRVDML